MWNKEIVEEEIRLYEDTHKVLKAHTLFINKIREIVDIVEDCSYQEEMEKVLVNLFSDLPLTPLTGEDEEWVKRDKDEKDCLTFNKRYPCLAKIVMGEGTVIYDDNSRYAVRNVNDDADKVSEVTNEESLLACRMLNKHCPIEFPYTPEVNRYKVYTDKKGDVEAEPDRFAVLYIEDYKTHATIAVNAFFKKEKIGEGEKARYVYLQIDKKEYNKEDEDE